MSYFRDRISECDTDRCRELHVESLLNILRSCRSTRTKQSVGSCLDRSNYLFDEKDRDAIVEHTERAQELLEGQLLDLFKSNGEQPRTNPYEVRRQGLSRGFSESDMDCVVGFDSNGDRIFDPYCTACLYYGKCD